MERKVGTVVRGLRCPIIREGDDLKKIVVESVKEATKSENITLNDKDVIGITESILARAQGNYATIDDIAESVKEKFKNKEEVALIFPITSRNRFAICLKGIARAFKHIYLIMSYPTDEVGNALLTWDEIDEANVDPYSDVLTLEKYRELFGYKVHEFTGIDYISYYKELIENEGCKVDIIFANRAVVALDYCKDVLCCDIHTRKRNKRILQEKGAELVFTLDDILAKESSKHGYNSDYGLLGSNKADENTIKLFPRNCQSFVDGVQEALKAEFNKNIEVLIYGDGAFKDPQGKIWELADPVVSPGHTAGLKGVPNELKLKYLADNDFKDLSGEKLKEAVSQKIKEKSGSLVANMASQGTTPRQLTDLIGSLCDLTSGSGDKGTPIILIQGYFDNYTD